MSRIVVFGVTGYAGGHITAELLDRGHTVVGVARGIAQATARAELELRAGSIYDPAFRTDTVKGADAVVVALPAHPAGGPDLDTIVSGLLDAAARRLAVPRASWPPRADRWCWIRFRRSTSPSPRPTLAYWMH
jgi:uncharacterized protein YbjT (DUF2867 family)